VFLLKRRARDEELCRADERDRRWCSLLLAGFRLFQCRSRFRAQLKARSERILNRVIQERGVEQHFHSMMTDEVFVKNHGDSIAESIHATDLLRQQRLESEQATFRERVKEQEKVEYERRRSNRAAAVIQRGWARHRQRYLRIQAEVQASLEKLQSLLEPRREVRDASLQQEMIRMRNWEELRNAPTTFATES
jgi:hypothetical protein